MGNILDLLKGGRRRRRTRGKSKDVQKLNVQRVKKQEKAAESIRGEDAHAAEEDAVKF